jgi:signal transduction histidine kinase
VRLVSSDSLPKPIRPVRPAQPIVAARSAHPTQPVQPAHPARALARERALLQAALRPRAPRVARRRLQRDRDLAARAAHAARRQLERDLHDGAQQRLVALALDLRVLEARAAGTELAPAVAELGARLAGALAELRDLARGASPAILTARGLGPALQGLAARAPLPVHVDARAIERLPEHVEATAYFVVAESLTNVARHACAGHATVAIHRRRAELVLRVADDGTGGADLARGTGLLGLRDRLDALGGTLAVDSEPGRGTHVVAAIPLVDREPSRPRFTRALAPPLHP